MKLRFFIGLAVLGAMSLIYNAAAVVLLVALPRARTRRLGRYGVMFLYRSYWNVAKALGLMRLDLGALDALRDGGPLIVAPNHPALFDAVLVISRLPLVCVMKSALAHNVFLGAGARLAGYVGNTPPHAMIRGAVEALRRGDQVLMFPEGTRTCTPPIGPLKRGIAAIARRAQVPIQTVFIETDSPFLRKGWPIWRVPPLPIEVHMRLGRRFAPSRDRKALLAELQAYYREALMPCADKPIACSEPITRLA